MSDGHTLAATIVHRGGPVERSAETSTGSDLPEQSGPRDEALVPKSQKLERPKGLGPP